MANNFNPQKIISETYRSDGTLATQLIEVGPFDVYLFQYDRNGHVIFSQKMDDWLDQLFTKTDITYNDGCVASITRTQRDYPHTKTVTQYDSYGHVTTCMDLNKNDIVNFGPNGYIRSIVKHIGLLDMEGIEEIQFNDNGYMVSSTLKYPTKICNGKWLTAEAKNYHPNGVLASHITYKQKTKESYTHELGKFKDEDEAVSYIASIAQYSESGQMQISVQLGEYDEVSFNGNKVACITRRVQKSDGSLETQSQTTYYASGNICTVTNYENGKVISSVTYDETGKPESSTQQGNEDFQDIFDNGKKTKYNKAAAKMMAKSGMTAQQAAKILGVSLNVSAQELKKAYRKLCFKWHPDHNQGNEAEATRMMHLINEAYEVMSEYIRSHNNDNVNNNDNPDKPDNDKPDNNKPDSDNQNSNQTDIQKAWNKLQQAIKVYENAKSDYEQAKRHEQDAREQMLEAHNKMIQHRTPENIDLYTKMRKIYDAAHNRTMDMWHLMLRAQWDKYDCEREYNQLARNQKWKFTSKHYAYQRAA